MANRQARKRFKRYNEHYSLFQSKKIPNKKTLDENGKGNPILGIVGEMERTQIKERQLEGIRIAKMKGVYKGRREGSTEDILTFLSKQKNRKAVEYIKKGYKNTEISKLTGLHINTLTKIKSIINEKSLSI